MGAPSQGEAAPSGVPRNHADVIASVADHIGELVTVLDRNGTILWVNRGGA